MSLFRNCMIHWNADHLLDTPQALLELVSAVVKAAQARQLAA